MFSFLVETMETAVKTWHETSKVDARVYFLLDKEKTDTDKYAPIVNIDKVLDFLLIDIILLIYYSPIFSFFSSLKLLLWVYDRCRFNQLSAFGACLF